MQYDKEVVKELLTETGNRPNSDFTITDSCRVFDDGPAVKIVFDDGSAPFYINTEYLIEQTNLKK